jgi:hypothetical protein
MSNSRRAIRERRELMESIHADIAERRYERWLRERGLNKSATTRTAFEHCQAIEELADYADDIGLFLRGAEKIAPEPEAEKVARENRRADYFAKNATASPELAKLVEANWELRDLVERIDSAKKRLAALST